MGNECRDDESPEECDARQKFDRRMSRAGDSVADGVKSKIPNIVDSLADGEVGEAIGHVAGGLGRGALGAAAELLPAVIGLATGGHISAARQARYQQALARFKAIAELAEGKQIGAIHGRDARHHAGRARRAI